MERAQMFIDRWMGKEDVAYTQWNITHPSKNEILPFAMTWMELDGIILSKISQSEKGKYHMNSLMWNLENKQMIIGEKSKK